MSIIFKIFQLVILQYIHEGLWVQFKTEYFYFYVLNMACVMLRVHNINATWH